MSEIPEADLLGLGLSSTESPSNRRRRSPSEDSIHSNESTLAALLQSIPNAISSALETIPSDSESVASDAFSVRSTNDPVSNGKYEINPCFIDFIRKLNTKLTRNNINLKKNLFFF